MRLVLFSLVLMGCARTSLTPEERGDSNGCVPSTCQELGKNCGALDDGCAGELECGGCSSPQSCGGGGITNLCGTTYTIAAAGGLDANSGLDPTKPWATFTHAWTVLTPGDTLVLLDGTYLTQLAPTVSGTPISPITIRADHPGAALLDGEGSRLPCRFRGTDADNPLTDLAIHGLRCERSSSNVISIRHAERLTFREVSARDAGNSNNNVILVWDSSDVLLEDVVASGFGRKMLSLFDSDRITVRRFFGRWEDSEVAATDDNVVIQIWGTNDSLIENVVCTTPVNALLHGMTSTNQSNRNRHLGNVFVGMPSWGITLQGQLADFAGNRYENNVLVGSRYGFFQRGDSALVLRNNTWANTQETSFSINPNDDEPKNADFAIHATVRNSVVAGGEAGFWVATSPYIQGLDNAYNILFDVGDPYTGNATPGVGEGSTNPGFDESALGLGTYLIAPNNLATAGEDGTPVGAEVLYRYQDGVLTDEPLWPWPMEDRILSELGVSVTWEAQGGLWRSLDGVYP